MSHPSETGQSNPLDEPVYVYTVTRFYVQPYADHEYKNKGIYFMVDSANNRAREVFRDHESGLGEGLESQYRNDTEAPWQGQKSLGQTYPVADRDEDQPTISYDKDGCIRIWHSGYVRHGDGELEVQVRKVLVQ